MNPELEHEKLLLENGGHLTVHGPGKCTYILRGLVANGFFRLVEQKPAIQGHARLAITEEGRERLMKLNGYGGGAGGRSGFRWGRGRLTGWSS